MAFVILLLLMIVGVAIPQAGVVMLAYVVLRLLLDAYRV
jgi:hypothetical protein